MLHLFQSNQLVRYLTNSNSQNFLMCKLLLDNISFQVWTNCVLLLYFLISSIITSFTIWDKKKLLRGICWALFSLLLDWSFDHIWYIWKIFDFISQASSLRTTEIIKMFLNYSYLLLRLLCSSRNKTWIWQ